MNGQNPYQENLENVLEKYGRDIVKKKVPKMAK